ncbi:MAG: aldehyde dehydrogenase family protein [Acidobacteriota bacterium]
MSSVLEAFETMTYGPAPESADAAHAWLEGHGRSFGLYVGDGWRPPATGETFETHDPATTEVLATIAQGGGDDVDAAVAAARAAQPEWWGLGPHGRARHLYAIARQIQKQSRFFAVLESLDNGKPIRETRDIDIPLVARHFYHHAGWAQLMEKELPGYGPVGVVGQVIPWNFPLLMLAWKVAPALATGNTVVLKPAEYTSLTALAFAEMCRRVGLPPGVLNIVTGDGRTGELLVRHPDVDKVAFTGSTEVGRAIRAATAGSGKKLSLELGGKSPFIVFDDADLDSAVEGVVDAIWFNQGQVCCAGSRLLVQEGVEQQVIAKLRARMETLRVGSPLDKSVDLGAIVAPVQLERISTLVDQGKAEGTTCWQPSWACPTEGWFYPPTLFTGVEPASTLAQVEIFGPVLVSMTFRTPEEAVALANDTRYGLAASVWTENVNLALHVAPQLAAGVVWVNCTNVFDAAAGFGGYRESGYGREGGIEGLWEYVVADWQRDLPEAAATSAPRAADSGPGGFDLPAIDRTAKMYVGGKQSRPDGGYSYPVLGPQGGIVGEAGLGNRKDLRNAVEAARKAAKWSRTTGHLRAQILYYVAENLSARSSELEARLAAMTGASAEAAAQEVATSVDRLFTWAAWADKYDGRVHGTPMRNVTLAMPEPWGILAVVCPEEAPLLAFVSLVAPAVAMGNRVVAVPSGRWPLAATDLYQVFDTSDVPGGVINIVTGDPGELAPTLARHDEVAAMWFFGDRDGGAAVERESVGNLKATWTSQGKARDWYDPRQGEGQEFLRRGTQIKNIWVPYGE